MEIIEAIIAVLFLIVFLVLANNVAILRNKLVRDAPLLSDKFRVAWAFGRREEATLLLEELLFMEWKRKVSKTKGQGSRQKAISKIKTEYSSEMIELNVKWPKALQ